MQAATQPYALFLIVITLGAGFVMLAPISPRLTVTFVIERPAAVPASLSIAFVGYEKIPLGTSLGSTRDEPLLTVIAAPQPLGPLTLFVNVFYSQQLVASGIFSNLAEGTYQIKVTFLPRQENKDVPYFFGLSVFENEVKLVEQVVAIYPV